MVEIEMGEENGPFLLFIACITIEGCQGAKKSRRCVVTE